MNEDNDPLTFSSMGNILRNWGTATTLTTAALLQGGCNDVKKSDRLNRPVASAAGADVPQVNVETKNAVQGALETQAAPNAEVSFDDETFAQRDEHRTPEHLRGEYGDEASKKLFEKYPALLTLLEAQETARVSYAVASFDVETAQKDIDDLGRLSTPEYSESDLEQLRAFLLKAKSTFVIDAAIASRATPIGEGWNVKVDEDFPQISLSVDRKIATVAILLSPTVLVAGIEIPREASVRFQLSKRGLIPGSTTIHNPSLSTDQSRSLQPTWFEGEIGEIFGSAELPAEETKAE